ncbi:MAG: acetyl-coenzyme A synthetase N-terminal domain-containing protein, partial [Balneolales bacterium]
MPKESKDDTPKAGDEKFYHPSKEVVKAAHIKDYDKVYKRSIENPESFSADEASKLEWYKKWDKVL